jgi:PleD family two-component response regulator
VSAHQAAKLAYAGQRNQQVFEACKRFNTFSSLEDTLALADTRKTRKLTAEEKEKLEKQREEQLQFLAHRDALTGLSNRAWFSQELTRSVEAAQVRRI